MTSPKRTVLSATAVKQFLDCSWLFYQTRVLKVPEHTHPKTKVGSLVHTMLEGFCRPKHRALYEATLNHQSIYGSKVLTRLVSLFRERNPDVTDEHAADIDKLVLVALNHDFGCADAKEVLPPEHPFEIDFGDFAIKGFMDRVIIYDNVAVIRDYKTQSKRFTGAEMEFSLQASFYQTAVKHLFGLPAKVEFILLRHPANRKDAQRYLQSIEPMTESQIEGFKYYLAYVGQCIDSLTPEGARANLKSTRDSGFCERVCSLKDPFEYWSLLGEATRPLASVRVPKLGIGDQDPDEWATAQLKPKDGQRVERRSYSGCVAFHG